MSRPFDLPGQELFVSGQALQSVVQLAAGAGQVAVLMRDQLEVSEKSGPSDLVTSADKKLSEILLTRMKELFPGDTLLSEEGEWQVVEDSSRRWYIDPIDGTKEYVKGTGRWSVMLGLVQGGQPRLGCIYIPEQKVTYFGGASAGAWCLPDGVAEPQPIAQLPVLPPEGTIRVLLTANDLKANPWVKDLPRVELVTGSSIGLDVSELLKGTADVFVHIRPTLKVWDTAAPAAIALGADLEAGTESTLSIPYGKDDARHPGCIVIGRRGCIQWWKTVWAART